MDLVTELFHVIAQRHRAAFETHASALDKLLQARDESRSPADENARRRLAHPRLKTSYPEREEMTLRAKIADDRSAVVKPAMQVIEKLLEIEHDEAIVASLREARIQTSQDLKARAETGLHPGAKRVVDRLRAAGVTRAHWAELTTSEIDYIGKLILNFSHNRRSADIPF